jgi:hypothetical protein
MFADVTCGVSGTLTVTSRGYQAFTGSVTPACLATTLQDVPLRAVDRSGPQPRLWVAAWITPGFGYEALPSLALHGRSIHEANLVITVKADGHVNPPPAGTIQPYLAATTTATQIPVIQDDFGITAKWLTNDGDREAYANEILQSYSSYAGVELDLEFGQNAAHFGAFVNVLAQKLHALGKTLTVDVIGLGSEDLPTIAAAADYVKFMAYPLGGGDNRLATLPLLELVIQRALAKVSPVSRIVIALPWYAYKVPAKTYPTSQSVLDVAAGRRIDYSDGEATVTVNGSTYYFQDETSYGAMLGLIQSYGISRLANWSAGGEADAVWTVLDSINETGRNFSASGPQRLDVVAGSTATATFSIAAQNGFADQASMSARVLTAGLSDTSIATTPSSVTEGSLARLTVTPPLDTPPRLYFVAVTFRSGTLVHVALLKVNVTAPPRSHPRSVR